MVTLISPVKVSETIHLFFSPIYALKSSWEVLAEWLCSLEFFRPMIYFYPFESGILADYIFICFSIWTMRDPVSRFTTDVTLGFDCWFASFFQFFQYLCDIILDFIHHKGITIPDFVHQEGGMIPDFVHHEGSMILGFVHHEFGMILGFVHHEGGMITDFVHQEGGMIPDFISQYIQAVWDTILDATYNSKILMT